MDSQLHKRRITSQSDCLFEEIWQIYQASFPPFEQRTLKHQQTAFSSQNYFLDAFTENNQLIGFIAYWTFETYCYIEHFAVHQKFREKGYGKAILQNLQEISSGKLIILEIDPLDDEQSRKRWKFYQNMGFMMNEIDHFLPEYQPGYGNIQLHLLTWPSLIHPELYQKFNTHLHKIVMRRE